MCTIHGCRVPTALLDSWTQLLVSEISPFFVTESLLARLPKESLVVSRAESEQMHVELSHRDSYLTYAIHGDGNSVVWLDPQDFDNLLSSTQTELLYAQWQLGRGQVYDWDAVRPLLQGSAATSTALSRVVETPGGAKLILDAALWTSLPVSVQRNWLIQFVEQQQAAYDILDPGDVPWDEIGPNKRPNIEALSNRFARGSGPNCFATTLAATTSRYSTARTIASSWLHQAPFLRGLDTRGYHQRPELHVTTSELRDAVLVWFDSRGTPQHSCYVLGHGVALNKNSQAWYTPHHLVALPDLLNYWSDEPLEVMTYQRDVSRA